MFALRCPACPICSAESTPAFIAAEHRMYTCAACRTAFVSPPPSYSQLAAFYQTFHLELEDGGCYSLAEQRTSQDFPAKIAWMKRSGVHDGSTVLDVGCGRGYFLRACQDAGLRPQGIDLSQTAVDFARDHLRVDALCGTLRELLPTLPQVDAVTLWATIEHLPDPAAALASIRSALKSGGQLFLDTGVTHTWLDRLLPGRTQWYDPPQHLWVFSVQGLQHLLTSAGFELLEIDRCFERTPLRRWLRLTRSLGTALLLRGVAEAARLRTAPFPFTRFPLGNLMAVRARRPASS